MGRAKAGTYKPLTDERVEEVCSYVRKGLTTKQACDIIGISYGTLEAMITGSEPRGAPGWAIQIARARAKCVDVLLERILRRDISTAEAKALHHVLYAIDKRFREDKASAQGGMVVQLLTPETKELLAQVITRALPAAEEGPE